MTVRALELNQQVTFKQRTDTKTAGGGRSTSWTERCTVWGRVRSLDGREAVLGSVLTGVSHFEIVIWHRDDIAASDQAIWRGRELNVLSAEDREGMRQWLWVIATTAGATQDA